MRTRWRRKQSSGLAQRQGHDVPLHEGPGGLGRGAHGGVGLGAGAAEAGVLRVGDEEQGQVPAWPGLPSPRGQDCGEGQQVGG